MQRARSEVEQKANKKGHTELRGVQIDTDSEYFALRNADVPVASCYCGQGQQQQQQKGSIGGEAHGWDL